jgi:hypothetical protein
MRERFDHGSYREQIERSKRRLADMEERGIEAMSRYDVEIAYGDNGQMALDHGKQLVSSHIFYSSGKLEELGPEVRQRDMFGVPAVSDVFNASELRNDDLETGFETERGEDFDDREEDVVPEFEA